MAIEIRKSPEPFGEALLVAINVIDRGLGGRNNPDIREALILAAGDDIRSTGRISWPTIAAMVCWKREDHQAASLRLKEDYKYYEVWEPIRALEGGK